MSIANGPARGSAVLDELARDVRRVADRLRSLPAARLEQRAPEVRLVLQTLADAASTLEAPGDAEPAGRTVPALPTTALGDQLEVLGTDLLVAARGIPPATGPVVAEAAAALAGLRRAL